MLIKGRVTHFLLSHRFRKLAIQIMSMCPRGSQWGLRMSSKRLSKRNFLVTRPRFMDPKPPRYKRPLRKWPLTYRLGTLRSSLKRSIEVGLAMDLEGARPSLIISIGVNHAMGLGELHLVINSSIPPSTHNMAFNKPSSTPVHNLYSIIR